MYTLNQKPIYFTLSSYFLHLIFYQLKGYHGLYYLIIKHSFGELPIPLRYSSKVSIIYLISKYTGHKNHPAYLKKLPAFSINPLKPNELFHPFLLGDYIANCRVVV